MKMANLLLRSRSHKALKVHLEAKIGLDGPIGLTGLMYEVIFRVLLLRLTTLFLTSRAY